MDYVPADSQTESESVANALHSHSFPLPRRFSSIDNSAEKMSSCEWPAEIGTFRLSMSCSLTNAVCFGLTCGFHVPEEQHAICTPVH